MDIASTATELRDRVNKWRAQGNRIGFVPTMGNLHAGHLKLVRHARTIADRVVVSIFVNPMQFGPNEDYENYPHTLEPDKKALMEADVDLLFTPAVLDIYPDTPQHSTRVEVSGLNGILCGESRPTHFTGVTTVVTKLFNLVQPDIAVFGEKDYQQLIIIRRMVKDLCMPVRIEGIETVREEDGLAMSSRNNYLSRSERAIAPQLYRVLCGVKKKLEAGERDYPGIEQAASKQLSAAGFVPEYVSIRRAADLAVPGPGDRQLIALAAANLGAARLIDNMGISIA